MIDSTVLTALIVAIPTVLSTSIVPLVYAWMNNKARLQERREDFARQDLIASRALTAVRQASENAHLTNNKLDVIHTLVNSNMTAALQAEFDAVSRELAVLVELTELKKTMGKEPTAETQAALKAARDRLRELGAILADRMKAAYPD